jgi:hypothetical protein
MTQHESQAARASFVMRDRRGRISGVIERVATGAKETFKGPETIGPVIARMVEYEDVNPAGSDTGHRGEEPSPRRRRPTCG